MAKSLNVLIGATLDSNVTKNLNAELEKLNLNKVEIQLGFDEKSVDGIKTAIKQSLTSAFNGISFVENEAKDIGQAIGENIAKGMQVSKKQVKRHLDDVVKETDKAAEKITKKLTRAFAIGDDNEKIKTSESTEIDYGNGFREVSTTRYRHKKDGSLDIKESFLEIDNREKIAVREAEKAAREEEKTIRQVAEIERKEQEKAYGQQLRLNSDIIERQRKAREKEHNLRQKELEETFAKEDKLFVDELEKQRKEKQAQSDKLYKYDLKRAEDLRKAEEKAIIAEGDRIIKAKKAEKAAEEALFKQWEKEYDAQAKAEEQARKEKKKAEDKEINEWIAAEERKEDASVALENKRLVNLKKTKSAYESALGAVNKIDDFDGSLFDDEQLATVIDFKNELTKILSVIEKENVETYELIESTKKLNDLQKQANNFYDEFSSGQKLDDRISSFNAQTERDIKSLRLQYGAAFDEDEYRRIRDISSEIARIIKEQGYNTEAVNKAFKKVASATEDFKTDLRVSKKEIKEIEDQARVLNSSLGRFIQFYGFGQLFGAAKTAGRDIFEQITLVNSSMTELRKVTDLTDRSYENFLKDSSENSRKLGVTMTDYIDSVTNFARMDVGGFEAAKEVAEVANIFQQVSENLTADQASEYLISNMKAWGYEAHETIEIVDVLNNLDRGSQLETSGQTLSFYRKTSRSGRPIPRIRLFYVMCA